MKKRLLFAVIVLALASSAAVGVEFGPISLGFHFIPAVEAGEGNRNWDVSFSFGVGLTLDDANGFEVHALTDSHLTSFGLTALYNGRIADRMTGGVGLTVLWPFDEAQRLLKPLLEAFAHAEATTPLGPIFRGELAVSFPLLTIAERMEGWAFIPLAELPSLAVAGEFNFADDAVFQGQFTLQPVITDTTQLERPIGRLSDNLLVLPLVSGFMRYMP
ncbi:MAG: hypothetical protein WBC63_08095 [Candidatus Bipolaricaulia bacterium]